MCGMVVAAVFFDSRCSRMCRCCFESPCRCVCGMVVAAVVLSHCLVACCCFESPCSLVCCCCFESPCSRVCGMVVAAATMHVKSGVCGDI